VFCVWNIVRIFIQYRNLLHLDKECKEPDYDVNGEVSVIMKYNKSVAIYSCNSGYKMDADADPKRDCIDGEWFGTTPACIKGRLMHIKGESLVVIVMRNVCLLLP